MTAESEAFTAALARAGLLNRKFAPIAVSEPVPTPPPSSLHHDATRAKEPGLVGGINGCGCIPCTQELRVATLWSQQIARGLSIRRVAELNNVHPGRVEAAILLIKAAG